MKIALKWNFFLALLLLGSCAREMGKKEGKEFRKVPRNQTHIDPDIQEFFRSQSAYCPSGDCHPSVGSLVTLERGKIKYCTATLVAEDVLLTSSNCLPRNLKIPNVSCVNNVYAIFPDVYGYREERSLCSLILASDSLKEDEDPALWKNDFAFIKLKTPLNRQFAQISKEGLQEEESYAVWKMEYETTEQRAGLKWESCSPFYDSYANPFAQNNSSPMITVRDCHLNEGSLGAPLFNRDGEVAAIFSAKMDKSLETYIHNNDILSEEMAQIQHASNLACAKLPFGPGRDGAIDKECFKSVNIALLDRYRSRLLNSREIHRENMAKVEQELERPEKYFMWDVKFYSNKKGNIYEAHFGRPKCFFNLKNWIDEFFYRWGRRVSSWAQIEVSIPKYALKTKLNSVLRPVSIVDQTEMKDYKMEFSPEDAYFGKKTYVKIAGQLFDNESEETFLNVTNNCSQ